MRWVKLYVFLCQQTIANPSHGNHSHKAITHIHKKPNSKFRFLFPWEHKVATLSPPPLWAIIASPVHLFDDLTPPRAMPPYVVPPPLRAMPPHAAPPQPHQCHLESLTLQAPTITPPCIFFSLHSLVQSLSSPPFVSTFRPADWFVYLQALWIRYELNKSSFISWIGFIRPI